MRFKSLLCGLVAAAELIPTDIDDLEVKLNPVIFTDQGQVENISIFLKCQKTAILTIYPTSKYKLSNPAPDSGTDCYEVLLMRCQSHLFGLLL